MHVYQLVIPPAGLVLFMLALLLTSGIGSAPWAAPDNTPGQPYAGQQTRTIKALSAKEIKDLNTGAGLGMAKAAELNQYPGPVHILQFADKLNLTKQQRRQVEVLYKEMKVAAIPLGKKIVAKEAALDRLFATGKITEQNLEQHVTEIARLKGRLRVVHLKVHLKSKPLLTSHQRMLYNRLRGYGKHSGDGKKHSGN